MFDSNGKLQSVLRTKRPAVLSVLDKVRQTVLQKLPLSVKLGFGLMLLVLVLLLTACATPSSTPTESARNPQPPQLSEPLPSESYSKRAAESIKSWAEKLIGM